MLGPIGKRMLIIELDDIREAVHVTLFTSLVRRPFPFTLETHHEMNTGVSFLAAVRHALEVEILVNGDFLILDGARVHFSADTIDELLQLLNDARVRFFIFIQFI